MDSIKFMTKVSIDGNGCWLWNGTFEGKRPVVYTARKRVGARKVSWELFVEPLADDASLVMHCDQDLCVNPSHMDKTESKVAAAHYGAMGGRDNAQEVCRKGHPLDGANVVRIKGKRRCRACRDQWRESLKATTFAGTKR